MLSYTAADVDDLSVSDFLMLCDGLDRLKRHEDEEAAKLAALTKGASL